MHYLCCFQKTLQWVYPICSTEPGLLELIALQESKVIVIQNFQHRFPLTTFLLSIYLIRNSFRDLFRLFSIECSKKSFSILSIVQFFCLSLVHYCQSEQNLSLAFLFNLNLSNIESSESHCWIYTKAFLLSVELFSRLNISLSLSLINILAPPSVCGSTFCVFMIT